MSSPFHRLHLRISKLVDKNPLYYGVPFVLLMVGASFGLTAFTRTRYELHDQTVQTVTKEQQLGLDRARKPFDVREAYFKLSSSNSSQDEEWDPSAKRIPRPAGVADWGEAPTVDRSQIPTTVLQERK
ncbi:cytochrome c oxidase assembly protein COX16-domain-containing protein [Flagelloscypha sp. PMI_526]|nr:cytochrome c oxidase assembly protein COX16-domain-containing protein [Flagelloscypha sp. PMI_526]